MTGGNCGVLLSSKLPHGLLWARLLLWDFGCEQTPGSTRHANPLLTHPIHCPLPPWCYALPPPIPWHWCRLLCGVFDHISFKQMQTNCTISKQACHSGWKHGRGAAGEGRGALKIQLSTRLSTERWTLSSSFSREWWISGLIHTHSLAVWSFLHPARKRKGEGIQHIIT